MALFPDKMILFSSPSGNKRFIPDGLLALGLWRNTSAKKIFALKKIISTFTRQTNLKI